MWAGLVCAAAVSAQDQPGQQVLSRAVKLHQSGHYAEAIVDYRIYLKVHPEAAAVRSNLGAALAHEGRYTEAVHEYTLALGVQPSNNGIRFNLGLAYFKMGEVEQATKEFEAVYPVLPQTEQRRALLVLSECYLVLGQDERVVALLDPVADADLDDRTLAYLLGTALLHLGKEERGALMIQRVLENGETAEAHMLMALTRMKASDSKGAVEEINSALALNPNLPEAYSLLGRLAFIVSDMKGAEDAFRKALLLDPNTFDAQLLLGTLLREQGRLPEAHTHLQRALELRPSEIRVRYQFALLCAGEGNDKRAVEVLEALVKDTPEYVEAHRSLSTIYFRLGRVTEGRQERKVAEAMDAAMQGQEQQRGRSLAK